LAEEVRKAARNCSVLVGLFRGSSGITGARVGRAFMAEECEIVV
jgi:aspartokinase